MPVVGIDLDQVVCRSMLRRDKTGPDNPRSARPGTPDGSQIDLREATEMSNETSLSRPQRLERLRHLIWVGHWSASAVAVPVVALAYLGFVLSTFA